MDYRCSAHLFHQHSQNIVIAPSVPKLICDTSRPMLQPTLAPDKHFPSLQIYLHFWKYMHGSIKYILFCGEGTWWPSLDLTTIYSGLATSNSPLLLVMRGVPLYDGLHTVHPVSGRACAFFISLVLTTRNERAVSQGRSEFLGNCQNFFQSGGVALLCRSYVFTCVL